MIKLLKSLLPFKGTFIKWGVIVGVVLLLAHSILSIFQKTEYEKELSKWKAIATRALALADSAQTESIKANRFADSLKVVASIQTTEIDRLKHDADVLSRRAPTIRWLRESLPDTCKVAIDAAETQTRRAGKLDSALVVANQRDTNRVKTIDKLTFANGLLNVSNDSLRKLITTVPEYKQPKIIGFIPYPSRKTSFVAGIVTGVASTLIIDHQLSRIR